MDEHRYLNFRLSGSPLSDAAKGAGLSLTRAEELEGSPTFQQLFRDALDKLLDGVKDKLISLSLSALKAIEAGLSEDAPLTLRVKTANELLDRLGYKQVPAATTAGTINPLVEARRIAAQNTEKMLESAVIDGAERQIEL